MILRDKRPPLPYYCFAIPEPGVRVDHRASTSRNRAHESALSAFDLAYVLSTFEILYVRATTEYPYGVPVEIRLRDVDFVGRVNNAMYATYPEEAREGFIQHSLGESLSL